MAKQKEGLHHEKTTTRRPLGEKIYDWASTRSPFAPASIHRSASTRMTHRSSDVAVAAPRKHRALRSFQISHETNANREPMLARLLLVNKPRSHLHQRIVDAAGNGQLVWIAERIRNQTSFVTGHSHRMWPIVSWAWSQRKHSSRASRLSSPAITSPVTSPEC